MAIPIHRIKMLADGTLVILIRGSEAEARQVSDILAGEPDVTVGRPRAKEGMEGFVYLHARGSAANPLLRDRAIELLSRNPSIKLAGQAAGDDDDLPDAD